MELMKKSNDYFDQPRRQSLTAILMIIIKTYKVVIRQLWPVLVIILLRGGSGGKQMHFALGLGAIAVLAMIYSIINFFRKYYYVDNGELVLESGIIGRKRVAIPFERIQTINFEQTLVHRVLSVVRLKADTAGSAKNEFELDAISKEDADLLRQVVMEGKKDKNLSLTDDQQEESIEETEEHETILQLGLGDLIKAGLTENHFRSLGIIFAVFYGLFENLQQAGVDVENYTDQASQYLAGLVVFVSLGILMLLVSLIVSMGRMVLANYDLHFLRFKGGFKIEAGLLTQKSVSAMDHKIQTISYSDNMLQKLIGLVDIRLKQAGSEAVQVAKAITIPGCNSQHVKYVTDTLYPDQDISNIEIHDVDRRLMYRQILFFLLLTIPFFLAGHFHNFNLYYVAALLLIYFPYRAYLLDKKRGYGYNDELLVIKGGAHGSKASITPIYKLQAVELTQTPYQRRKDLATLVLHNAAGKDRIPYIDLATAQYLHNLFLYKVESDNRDWM